MAEDWGRRQQAARESWVPVGEYKVKIRRPDHIELRRYDRSGEDIDEALVLKHVIDWQGITEAMLAPGVGGEEKVEFSAFAWREWIGGRPADFNAIARAIVADFNAHQQQREAIEGKSPST